MYQRVIADCACLNDAIYDEWLAFDQGAVTRQLGQHPRDFARSQIALEGGPGRAARPFNPSMDVQGDLVQGDVLLTLTWYFRKNLATPPAVAPALFTQA